MVVMVAVMVVMGETEAEAVGLDEAEDSGEVMAVMAV